MFKRALIIVATAGALALTGCAGGDRSILAGGTSITATIDNPVTVSQQAAVEATYGVVASAALAYSRLRRCGPGESVANANVCSNWSVVKDIMKYDAVAYAEIANLRRFMAQNKTVSAITAYNAAVKAIRDLRAVAFVNGIKVEN